MLAQLNEMTGGSDTLSAAKRAELRGVISTRPGLNRYLRITPGGLLRTSDPKLPAEDIALGCKQLLEVERGWRDLKQVTDLRPVYHRTKSASARTSSCAGWPCCSSGSRRPPPA